ncbi:general secretion pathway protein GspI [Vibrio cholerae]|nr:general secretion pathway protein GspI [Vibrio cholerae]MBO1397937.1 general secretion pathway protein GspI [Vibrio cholerae]
MQLLCLSLVLMRCQPLRRALVSIKKNHQKLRFNVLKNQLSSCPTWFLSFRLMLLW